ncbi:hypothetical protein D3C71_2110750 [compost metagenome]
MDSTLALSIKGTMVNLAWACRLASRAFSASWLSGVARSWEKEPSILTKSMCRCLRVLKGLIAQPNWLSATLQCSSFKPWVSALACLR